MEYQCFVKGKKVKSFGKYVSKARFGSAAVSPWFGKVDFAFDG